MTVRGFAQADTPLFPPGGTLDRATVAITGYCNDRGAIRAEISAGVIVGQRAGVATILTVAHMADCRYLKVRYYDDDPIAGHPYTEPAFDIAYSRQPVQAADEGCDIGIIHAFEAHEYPIVTLASAFPPESERVTVIGHRGGELWHHSAAAVLIANEATPALTCSDCGPGDSGGGVFTADGQLVGLIFGTTQATLFYVSGSRTVQAWLPNKLAQIRFVLETAVSRS